MFDRQCDCNDRLCAALRSTRRLVVPWLRCHVNDSSRIGSATAKSPDVRWLGSSTVNSWLSCPKDSNHYSWVRERPSSTYTWQLLKGVKPITSVGEESPERKDVKCERDKRITVFTSCLRRESIFRFPPFLHLSCFSQCEDSLRENLEINWK